MSASSSSSDSASADASTSSSSDKDEPVQIPEKVIPHLLPIEKNRDMINRTIFTNIVKMLIARKLINKEREEELINSLTQSVLIDLIYKIKLDNYIEAYGSEPESSIMIIKFVNQKISSITKSSGFNDILTTYKNNPKILIVSSINPKLRYHIRSGTEINYKFLEIFLEPELLINIIDHVSQPNFELLNDETMKEVIEVYNAKRRDIPKMLIIDPIATYYNAKNGQLFRIIRPSETACQAVSYRLVIKGLVKDN
jgi:DNA-directed RNA polymerase subunit H (RpoH/RPB5)